VYAAQEGKRLRSFDPEVEAIMLAYDWPGNVRQLQNVIQNVVVLYDGDCVTRDMLPAPLDALDPAGPRTVLPRRDGARSGADQIPAIRPLRDVERQAIEQAIAYFDDNIPRAAAALGVSPSTIYRKRQSWDENRP
jgi:two-component system repressor protein LuxO